MNNMDEVISDSKGNGHTEDQIMTLEDVSGDNQSAFDEKSNSTPLSTEDSHYSTSPVQDLMSTQNQPLRHDMMQLPGNQQLGKHNESNMKTEPKTMSISSIEILENITKTENGNVSMVAADEVVDDSGTTQSNDIPTSIRTVDEHWTESTHVATESNMMKDQAKKIEDTDSLATEINVPDSKDDSSDMIGDKDNISEKASNGRTLDHADNSSTNDKDIFESKDTSSEMAHNKYRSDPEDEALDETLKQNWSESKDDSSDVSLEGENSEFDHNLKDMTGEKDTANQESQTVEVSQEH
ncbi:uncharacterized protein LOC143246684 [Tachypleus tridentatus]|uniref:uncharacterized protein LOC143246684 n=1 Tax=Tachypleus tridentatus TaxID=6853 RepID=UPI003FD4D8DA